MTSIATPEGYSLVKCLRDSPRSNVLLALREADGREVVLKAYHSDRNRSGAALHVQREFDMLRSAAGPCVPVALDLLTGYTPAVLVLERVPGISLSEWIAAGPVEVPTFLAVALQLIETLARVHAARLIHRDITPDNVLIDPATLETHLIDFGIAKPLGAISRSDDATSLPESLAGTLLYIPPEQTGRMNRGCDSRSDLYSVGATFYHMLTGHCPFDSTDALELIHAHIARLPKDPLSLRADLPAPLGQLLLRLLRKDPEERYQSARSLHADLKACSDQLARRGQIDASFVLGSGETPDRPRFSARLHGREREIARLHELYGHCARGERVALILRGEPGSGKSALVNELRPALAESGGYLAVGKFDPYRERPYAGWVVALESLASQLLVESDERLARWKRDFGAALGSIGRALVDLVPDLQFVLGDLPPVPPLGPRETQARLSLALQRFFSACATPEHPLVLFLDDLQWSDAGSRLLLEEVLSGPASAVLVIAAYPPGEVGDGHPVTALLQRAAARGDALEILDLPALGSTDVLAMLAEALGQAPEATRSLAELIVRKTGASPLLVRQFVEHIHGRGLLRHQEGAWRWDLAEIAAADIPDGAVALMTAKIQHLGEDERRALALASCIGDEFDIELLGEIGGDERAALTRGVHGLCDQGLIAACAQGFRFVHDRIREAAQSLLSDAERERLHYETGRLLLERTPEEELPQKIFAVVEHLNRGLTQIPRELELRVIQLNVQAGKRALATGAGATAAGYLALARGLFQEPYWSAQFALGVDLYLQSAEAAFQSRDFEQALRLLDTLDARPLARMDVAQSAAKRLRTLALIKSPEECVRCMLEVLRGFGLRWPMHPSRLRARIELLLVSWQMRLQGTDRLVQRATKLDPEWLAPLLVLGLGGAVTIRFDIHLAVLSTTLAMRRYLRSGFLSSPSFRIATYGAYCCVVLGNPEKARAYARLALEWNERYPTPIYAARGELVVHALIHPWIMRRRQALAPMERVAESAREIGDPEFTYYAHFLFATYMALGGDAVPLSERRLREVAESVKRSGHWFPEPDHCHDAYRRLSEGTDPAALDGAIAEGEARLGTATGTVSQYAHTLWLMVFCIYRRHDLAFALSETKQDEVFRVMPFVHIADHMLYRGLAAAALAARSSGTERRRYRRALAACLRRMRRWASAGPDFVHMASLLAAERAWLQGRADRARALYESAAQRALAQEFPHHAALAYEARAQMLIELRRETEAGAALAQASHLYREWGAIPKAQELREKRRQLIGS